MCVCAVDVFLEFGNWYIVLKKTQENVCYCEIMNVIAMANEQPNGSEFNLESETRPSLPFAKHILALYSLSISIYASLKQKQIIF